MADSILVNLTKAVCSLLETQRTAEDGIFTGFDFELDWDFDGRLPEVPPQEEVLYVRAMVPRHWRVHRRHDRGSLERVAVMDIDFRMKLGAASHSQPKTEVGKLKLDRSIHLVETTHDYFFKSKPRFPFNAGDRDFSSVWAAEIVGLPEQSRVLVAYSDKYLREQRLFYGACREVFQVLETDE